MRPVWTLLAVLIFGGCDAESPESGPELAPLRIGGVLGDRAVEGFARADAPREFQFPRDHAAHDDFRSEWWYLTMTLRDEQDQDIGVQFTVFRQALSPEAAGDNPWQSNQAYLGHLAVTDVAAGRHREFERFARGHPALAGSRPEPFGVWLDGWRLAADTAGVWHLEAPEDGVLIDLQLIARQPVVLQGERGLSRKGPGQASYYFSVPRFEVSGTVTLDGSRRRVSGGGWYDREWSTSVLSDHQIGWDWFALQFDDGGGFMGFQLRRSDGQRDPYDYALQLMADGEDRRYAGSDFTFEPVRFWRDDAGVRWPVEWQLQVPGEGLSVRQWRVVAALDDQRMDTSLVYWEGLVYVYDQQQKRIGQGYMELTGYADE